MGAAYEVRGTGPGNGFRGSRTGREGCAHQQTRVHRLQQPRKLIPKWLSIKAAWLLRDGTAVCRFAKRARTPLRENVPKSAPTPPSFREFLPPGENCCETFFSESGL